MTDETPDATAVHYSNVAPYAITRCADHWHVTRDGEHIATTPNELTRDQALDEMDRMNREAGWPTIPAPIGVTSASSQGACAHPDIVQVAQTYSGTVAARRWTQCLWCGQADPNATLVPSIPSPDV